MIGHARLGRRPRRSALRRAFALVAVIANLVGVAAPPALFAASPTPGPGEQASPIDRSATVLILAGGTAFGQAWFGSAYGVVLDPSGLVLAPASVVAPDAPGLALRYLDPGLVATANDIAVGVYGAGGGPPTFQYNGEVLAADGYLDLAIVRLVDAETGQPPAPGTLNLPAVPLSTHFAADGEAVRVVDAQDNIATAATVTELISDDRIPVGPGLVRTDMVIDEDEPWSGQLTVLDASGALLAFANFHPYRPPVAVEGRPAALIQPLLDAARSGLTYTSPYVVPGNGQERFVLDGWTAQPDPCSLANPTLLTSYPSGINSLNAQFRASGFTPGEDLLRFWYDVNSRVILAFATDRWSGSASRCFGIGISAGPGQVVPDGDYGLAVFAGGHLRRLANERIHVGAAVGNLTITGRVIDADTGEPIEGA